MQNNPARVLMNGPVAHHPECIEIYREPRVISKLSYEIIKYSPLISFDITNAYFDLAILKI